MNMATKNEIFERYKKEYWNASRRRKGEILKNVVDVVKMHVKSAIKRFRRLQTKEKSCLDGRGRPVVFTKDANAALETIWEVANEPCGELLFPMIREYVATLQRDKMWKHGDVATGKLFGMSEHTVRRRVASFDKAKKKGKGLSGTKPSLLKSIIPIFSVPWKGMPPGYGQIDTVAHCGHSLLMTRSEPGKKNHNMYVEERNGHVVRKYLGYMRLDQKELVKIVNELYDVLALYLNHFQAVRRTLSKERVGAKYRRTYEKTPKTPYQRMLEHEKVPEAVKEKLRTEHAKLNPLLLKKEIDRLTAKILQVRKTAAEPTKR
jgi:hypothetical protein